ncbi:MAG: hypothetical protein AB1671_15565 [Thermodesulfobacteriota bacterium]|jgi:hypothetical protein
MRVVATWAIICAIAAGCYQRQDPVVRAAQDLRRMAYDFAEEEEDRQQRLRALRLGMSDSEVLDIAGPPSSRESRMVNTEESREVWIYRGALRPLATLIFVNNRLTEIHIQ